MSRKLSYTAAAFAMRIRMSREAALFIVVEGRDIDVPFYEGIAKSSAVIREKGYQVWLVEQITREIPGEAGASPRAAGGKHSIFELHEIYKRADELSVSKSYGKRSVVFCVDKDLDDVAKTVRRAPNIVYTPMADSETTVLAVADAVKGLVGAASLSESDARGFLAKHPDVMDELATHWRAWIELCALAIAHSAHCHVGTTKSSRVNQDTYGAVVRPEIVLAKKVIRRKSQISASRHAMIECRVMERIQRTYSSGNGRRFVGKHWVIPYLAFLLKGYFGEAPVGLVNLKHKAPVAYLAAVDFSGSWATAYRRKFEALV